MITAGVKVSIAPECEGSEREVEAFGARFARCPVCESVQRVTRRTDRDRNTVERIARHDDK